MTARQSTSGNRTVVERNGTNTWQLIIMGVAVLLSLLSQFWTLANPRDDIRTTRIDLQQAMDRQEKELRDLIDKGQKRLEELTRQNDEHFAVMERRLQTDVVSLREHEEFVKREDARISALEQIAAKLQDNLVTRAEHQTHWSETDQKFANLNSRLEQLSSQIVSALLHTALPNVPHN
jgi:chromosome segregation ATPase